MNKFIALFALASATASLDLDLYAADGTVTLTNYDSNNPIFYFALPPLPLLPLPVQNTYVQVLGGPVGMELRVLASSAPGNPTIFTLSEPGFFDGGFGVVPGVAEGAQGSFMVRAWRSAVHFDAAVLTERSQSSMFIQTFGSNPPLPGIPAPAPLQMPSFSVGIP